MLDDVCNGRHAKGRCTKISPCPKVLSGKILSPFNKFLARPASSDAG